MTDDVTSNLDATDEDLPKADLQVVARVATLMRLFNPRQPTLKPTQAAEALGMRRSTIHRYLSSLELHGFLKKTGDGGYELGPLVDQLASLGLGRWRIQDAAGPIMDELAAATQHTAVLSVWGGSEPVITQVREDSSQTVHVSVRVGATLPVDSAQGLIFLAFLKDGRARQRVLSGLGDDQKQQLQRKLAAVAQRRIAMNQKVVQGVRTIAVPILGSDGNIRATLAVVGTTSSVPDDIESGIAQALRAAGQTLTELIADADPASPPAAHHAPPAVPAGNRREHAPELQ
ncbi:IclR family transcriptional regulator [Nocardia sp. NPDC019395]|uniref:IclR family transcriptional regulator n=1 Tax=Nocardia sp. NPDC019395 TaxID=3154686 RepID=UPI0033F2DA9F